MNTFLQDEQHLVVPDIANLVMPVFIQDRSVMASIHADIAECQGLIREHFLKCGWIRTHDGSSSDESINVVDASYATATLGEFSTALAFGVNVATGQTRKIRPVFQRIFAPNSEAFGMIGSPILAAVEAISLAPSIDEKYTLYDGSLQGLNANLGNLFRTQDEAASDHVFLKEISEYTTVLNDLFLTIVDPAYIPDGNYVGKTVYSSIFNQNRQDLFAISKKNTSTYTFHRLKELEDVREKLGDTWFAYPKTDRLLLSQILEAGEYIGPIPFERVESKSGRLSLTGLADVAKKGRNRECNEKAYKEFNKAFYFLFFKPSSHSSTMRIEMVSSSDFLDKKVQDLLRILTYQCSNPGLVEPYGLWLADKIAKQIQPFKSIYGSANAAAFPELFKPNRTEDIKQ